MRMICFPSHSWGHVIKYGENVRHAHLLAQMLCDDEIERLLWVSRVRPDKLRYNIHKRTGYNRKAILPLPGGFLYRISQYGDVKLKGRYIYEHSLPYAMDFIVASSVRLLFQKKLKQSFLWVGDPKESCLGNLLDVRRSAFDAMDNWNAAPEFIRKKKRIAKGYQASEKYDLIFANTQNVAALFDGHKQVVILPNATESVGTLDSLKDVEQAKFTSIGLVGNLNGSRCDYEILNYIAENNADCRIFIAGKISKVEMNSDNIQQLGWLNRDELYQFYRQLDLLIVPRPVTPYTLSQDSIAVYEALGCGVPVVSAPLHPALELDKLCYIADNKQDWLTMINKALKETDEQKITRMKEMENHTWKKRYEVLKGMLFDG